ncbi:MAG TPA: hypothetical protein PLQ39_12385, partial [Acinetobacter sp.]|nr:hypothetical protein [Acinetobacter sp.]
MSRDSKTNKETKHFETVGLAELISKNKLDDAAYEFNAQFESYIISQEAKSRAEIEGMGKVVQSAPQEPVVPVPTPAAKSTDLTEEEYAALKKAYDEFNAKTDKIGAAKSREDALKIATDLVAEIPEKEYQIRRAFSDAIRDNKWYGNEINFPKQPVKVNTDAEANRTLKRLQKALEDTAYSVNGKFNYGSAKLSIIYNNGGSSYNQKYVQKSIDKINGKFVVIHDVYTQDTVEFIKPLVDGMLSWLNGETVPKMFLGNDLKWDTQIGTPRVIDDAFKEAKAKAAPVTQPEPTPVNRFSELSSLLSSDGWTLTGIEPKEDGDILATKPFSTERKGQKINATFSLRYKSSGDYFQGYVDEIGDTNNHKSAIESSLMLVDDAEGKVKAISENLAMFAIRNSAKTEPVQPNNTLQKDISKSELFKDANVWAIDDFGKENGMVIYSRDEQDGFSIGIVDKLKQVNMQYTDIDTDQQTNESFSTENITNEQVIEKIKMFIAKHEQKSVELLPVQPASKPPMANPDRDYPEPTPASNKKMYTPKDILDSDLSIDEKISEAEKLLESSKLNAAKQKIKIDESNKF